MGWTDKLDEWGPMTVLMILVAVVAVGVGGVVVVVHPETLTFEQYLDNLKTFALAIAGLAGARGILGAGKHVADATVQAAAVAAAGAPHDLSTGDLQATSTSLPFEIATPAFAGEQDEDVLAEVDADADPGILDDDDLLPQDGEGPTGNGPAEIKATGERDA